MRFGLTNVPVAPVRRRASHKSELVNQLLYGEAVAIQKIVNKWCWVKSMKDGYSGWVTQSQLQLTQAKPAGYDAFVTGAPLTVLQPWDGSLLQLPMGSFLPGYNKRKRAFENGMQLITGEILERNRQRFSEKKAAVIAKRLLHAPYLWGGKTVMGVDCSGFVQIVFRLMSIDLPRDAWQQAEKGKRVPSLTAAKPGDLAFFDDKEEIVHVGMLLNNQYIIHASGKVRVDPFTANGIVPSETGKLTHRLRLIKRIR